MYKIEDGLWQGGEWTGYLPEEFSAVLSLTMRPPEYEEGRVWVWVPFEDGRFPGLEWLEMVVNIVKSLRDAGKTLYIHCHAGISRSTMVTAAYLIAKYNWEVDQALNHIAITNDSVDPNPHFMKGLKDWRKYTQSWR